MLAYKEWTDGSSIPLKFQDEINQAFGQSDSWLEKLLKSDSSSGRDFLSKWTSGKIEPIKIGDHVIGQAYFDTAEGKDYTVVITDPEFLGRIKTVHEADGRVRHHGTECRTNKWAREQFMGRIRQRNSLRHFNDNFNVQDSYDQHSLKARVLSEQQAEMVKSVVVESKDINLQQFGDEVDTYQCDFHISPREEK